MDGELITGVLDSRGRRTLLTIKHILLGVIFGRLSTLCINIIMIFSYHTDLSSG